MTGKIEGMDTPPHGRAKPGQRRLDDEKSVTSGEDPTADAARERGLTSDDIPSLTVAAVAQRLGVAPATLRTWDRRYGLGPSGHAAGAHRRYSADDLARLVVMRRLALDGVAPQDAAKAALEADISKISGEQLEAELRGLASAAQADKSATGSQEPGQGNPDQQDATSAAILHLPSSSHRDAVTAAAVIEAVQAGREDECQRLLTLAVTDDPVVWWRTIVQPAIERLAMRTVLARPGETPDLLLISAAFRAIGQYVAQLDVEATRRGVATGHPSRNREMVLAFVAPGEPLALATHVFAAAMLRHGVAVRIVTGPANEHRVLEVVTMVRPVVTVMISDLVHPDLSLIHALHTANPDLPIVAGLRDGPAIAELPVAPSVQRIRSFEGIVHEVLAVLAERRK